MAHAVVRTDNLYATDVRGGGLVSFKYSPSNTDTEIDNGCVVLLGDLIAGEREVYAASTPAADSPIKDIVLVATPELFYDGRYHALSEWVNEAGSICRGYHLHTNDTFGITIDAINNTKGGTDLPAVGDVVELYAGVKFQVPGTSATSDSTVVGSIIAVETAGAYTYYVVKVA